MQITKDMVMGLEQTHLIDIDTNQKASAEAFLALCDLKKRLAAHGFVLDIASAFRPFSRQMEIFNAKYNMQRKVFDRDNNELNLENMSPMQRVEAICIFSSVPGFSRHHFGSDFDIYSKDLLPEGSSLALSSYEYTQGGYFYEMHQALVEYMAEYDFFMPYTGDNSIGFEPWHISYYPSATKCLEVFDFDYACDHLKSLKYPWSESVCIYLQDKYRQMLAY